MLRLRDITGMYFLPLDKISLIDGTMPQGSYVMDVDSFSSIKRNKERVTKEKLVADGHIGDVEDGVTTTVKEALPREDVAFSKIMKNIMRKTNVTNKTSGDLLDIIGKKEVHQKTQQQKEERAL